METARTNQKRWRILALALIAVLLLAACGGNDDSSNTSDTTADTTAQDTDQSAAQPDAPALLPGQRDAPVPVSAESVNDPASLVGNTGKPQLVEFFTYWCTVCKSIKPEIHSLEAEYFGAVDFVYLDREDGANEALVDQFGIFGQPVLILVDADGNELQRWFGHVDTDDLRAAFDDVLAN